MTGPAGDEMTQTFPNLFTPITLGPKQAKNRVMRVATTANLAEGNRVGSRVLALYRALAKGGVGTIVTEALRVQPQDPFGPGALVIFERDALDGLRKLADAMPRVRYSSVSSTWAGVSTWLRESHPLRLRRAPSPAREAAASRMS